MAYLVSIGNMALDFVGSDEIIESYNEKSQAADLLNRWYDQCRKEVLEAYNWGFARTRLQLAASSDDPPAPWQYRYQYPSNCLKMRKIVNPISNTDDVVPYDIFLNEDADTRTIVTNMAEAVAEYTADVSSSSLFSAHFKLAFARLLASRIAPKLTVDMSIADSNFERYLLALAMASGYDANEAVAEEARDGDLVSARE